jgi:peptidoglycan/xylan/chitin deacetylase (PgdA/CDA1 family)
MAALKASGKKIVTLKSLYDLIIAQESRDARVGPDWVVVTIAGVNAQNVKAVSDTLDTANVDVTLFIGTKDVGITGITEKTILNLLANGNDLQSEAHAGDDLRSLTDSQVMLELGQSKKILEDLTKREVYAVSYPMGGVNDRVMKKAGELGYLLGISQSPDKKFTRGQFLRLPSLFVSSTATPDEVASSSLITSTRQPATCSSQRGGIASRAALTCSMIRPVSATRPGARRGNSCNWVCSSSTRR